VNPRGVVPPRAHGSLLESFVQCALVAGDDTRDGGVARAASDLAIRSYPCEDSTPPDAGLRRKERLPREDSVRR